MPRKLLIKNAVNPYHIYNRSNDKKFWPLPLDQAYQLFSSYLYSIHVLFGIKIHAFVLMGNHYHLLISDPHLKLSEAMEYFQREVSKEMSHFTKTMNHRFGGRYKWTMIERASQFCNVYKYIYRNPCKAGLIQNAEDYPFSSLNGLLGYSPLRYPIAQQRWLFHAGNFCQFDLHSQLPWLNTSFEDKEAEGIRLGLRRNVYSPPATFIWKGKRVKLVP